MIRKRGREGGRWREGCRWREERRRVKTAKKGVKTIPDSHNIGSEMAVLLVTMLP